MAFGAFSKNSGPSGTSRRQPVFGNVSISTTSPQTPKVFALDNDAPPPQRSPSSSHNGGIKSAPEFSPPLFSSTKVVSEDSDPNPSHGDRAAISPPRLWSRSNLWEKNASSQTQLKSALLSRIGAEGAKPKVMNSQVPKRTRSPPLASADEVLLGNSYSELDSEREMQAKAKRLARFGVELSQPVQSNYDPMNQKSSGNRQDQALVERRKIAADQSIEATGDFMSTDYGGLESSSVIIGLCPDMCPESERDERERKGDLDKYERLDGDRNLTSKSLAVKKYNRMAEREADLIRPMPVLQKTMVYLLALLDQPYGDDFLGLYNFLWDRMRAIRMDLRMQHIFNEEAITMLEQMIRFHIIAMHELCEYTKGEGFSEGFDAHLNIEQMNKTSVELFQMYDDHKKNGISVPSEKEFRGYYALLKLDKHPGYKVEPAELSLDLAKMSPEIRQTREILFARDVARACRTGNFIAFFRLAGKATYLQACLMHAHFAKLRTQAFASLHSGLQSNQGIPISHITKWLGMEGEDIESLLEYHGFLIKEYEEPYMVKEGPFLNNDKDYLTKCSQLVHLKKSKKIIKDVSSIVELLEPADQAKQAFSVKMDKHKPPSACFVDVKEVFHADEEMTDHGKCTTPIDGLPVPPIFEMPFTTAKSVLGKTQAAEVDMSSVIGPSIYHFPQPTPAKLGKMGQMAHQTLRSNSLDKNILSRIPCISQETVAEGAPQIDCSDVSYIGSVLVNSAPHRVAVESKAVEGTIYPQNVGEKQAIIQGMDNEEDVVVQQKNEVAMAKLKLILRIWKRRSSKQKEMRELRQLAASAALSSLSLGLPIRRINNNLGHVIELDIDHAMRERRERQGRSWSRLNISKVIAEILCIKNPGAKCLCWKLIFCSQMKSMKEDRLGYRNQVNSSASQWLFTKLMGASNVNDDGLAYSSPGLSIWKNWVSSCHDSSTKCCLSVVREIEHDKLCDIKGGANAILFLASESISLELQKTQLHNILMSLPLGSNLPLLVVSDTYREEMLFDGLDLLSIDKTRLSSFTFVSLVENHPSGYSDGFFSNDRLVEGLQWLASQSRLQPVLRRVQTRDLVMDQLSSLLQVLENMNASVISPNQCISAFNEALHQSAEKVATVAEKIPGIWPCPEVYLLEESSDERKVVKSFLPSMGWCSVVTLESIISAIQGCMLPVFPDDLSWLNCGSDMGKEIHTQKSKLELCLFQYLADSGKIMDWTLAAREASVMVQKAALLELHGMKHRIIPRWLTIFKRIFQWRLMNLTAGAASVAYVLETEGESCQETCDFTPVKFCKREFSAIATSPWSEVSDNPKLEGDFPPPSALSQLSLDEMVEVCCSPILSGREQSKHAAFQPHSGIIDRLYEAADIASGGEVTEEDGKMLEERSFAESGDSLLSNCHHSAGRMIVTSAENRESDRLQKLLAQCNKLQDTIDAKLSIYF